MVKHIKKLYNHFCRYYVLSLSTKGDRTSYHLAVVLFRENEFLIEEQWSTVILEELIEYATKEYPLIVHIEGDNIINKSVENRAGYRKNVIFKAAIDDFYFYEYKQDDVVYVSVARKAFIDTHLKRLGDLNTYIVNVSYGPFVMANLLFALKGTAKIASSNYCLDVEKSKIIAFKKHEESAVNYTINDDNFSQKEVPLVAAFFNYKLPIEAIEFDTDFLRTNREEFKFKRWFKIAGISALVFLLLSIVTSNVLLDVYLNALSKKETTYLMFQQTSAKVKALKEEKALKEKILKTSGMVSHNFIAKYMVDIGNSIPQGIALKAIDVNPLLKKIKPKTSVGFTFNTIKVRGTTHRDGVFNAWIKNIKTLSWVRHIEIIAYDQEYKSMNTFEIEIYI